MSLLDYTAQITKAYFAHNRVPIEEVPFLIERVHASLKELSQRQAAASALQSYAESQGLSGALLGGHSQNIEPALPEDPVEKLRTTWLEDMVSEKLATAQPWHEEMDDEPESIPSSLAERRGRLGFDDSIWDVH